MPWLSEKQELFCRYYIRHANASRAARECGTSPATAADYGYKALHNPDIAKRIQELRAALIKRLDVEAEEVVRTAAAIAFHDATKISQMRTVPCDHCWDNWYDEASKAISDAMELAEITGEERDLDDDEESLRRPATPDPNCSCCRGEGKHKIWFADTRDLSGNERIAFCSAYMTKDGKGVEISERVRCLDLLAKHFGLYKEQEKDTRDRFTVILNGIKLPPSKDAS